MPKAPPVTIDPADGQFQLPQLPPPPVEAVEPAGHQHPADVSGWYLPAKHLTNLFIPLAVLQTLSQNAAADGTVSTEKMRAEIPQGILYGSINFLATVGYIGVLGDTITIKKLPIPRTP